MCDAGRVAVRDQLPADEFEGDVYVLGLEPENRLVYEERLTTFVRWDFTLAQARLLARSDAAKSDVRRLIRRGCDRELVVRICA